MAETNDAWDAQFWDQWWAADFSWDGLRQTEWRGWSRSPDGEPFALEKTADAPSGWPKATLQDYWRQWVDPETDLTEIADREGQSKRFTEFHLPYVDGQGEPTFKAGWSETDKEAFADRLAPTLEAATESDYDNVFIDRDCRAQWKGVVAPRVPSGPSTLYIHASFAHLSIAREWSERTFGNKVDFNSATFSGYAGFNSATFSNTANFDSATFSGWAHFDSADFKSATFSGYAYFNNATFSGRAIFESATFSNYASFNNATFSGRTIFESATFNGYATFESATFSDRVHFERARFSRWAYFGSATFSDRVHFERARFSRWAYFGSATFSGSAHFDSAAFSGYASFNSAAFNFNATFESATFSNHADFDSATFNGDASFNRAYFSSLAMFAGSTMPMTTPDHKHRLKGKIADKAIDADITVPGGPTMLAGRAFAAISFVEAVFDSDAIFDNRQMLGTFTLTGAQFLGRTSFHGVTWHPDFSVNGAQFRHVVEPKKSEPLPKPTDDQLQRMWRADRNAQDSDFEKWEKTRTDHWKEKNKEPPERSRFQLHRGWQRHKAWQAEFLNSWTSDWTKDRLKRISKNGPDYPGNTDDLGEYNARWDDIERAFQTLKEGMEKLRRRTEEQRFHRLELLARRRRRDEQVRRPERWASFVYDKTSKFGGSITRPLVTLFACYLFFAAIYFGSALAVDPELHHGMKIEWGAPVHPAVEDALSLSGQLTLPPFVNWAADATGQSDKAIAPATNRVASAIYQQPNFFWRLFARLVGLLQSLFSLIMIFLTGLALRRRFQIH